MAQRKGKNDQHSSGDAAHDGPALILDYLRAYLSSAILPCGATEISTNLQNRITKGRISNEKRVDRDALGKQVVYHALQETCNEATPEIIAALDEKAERLQEQVTDLQATEKKTRAELAVTCARPLLSELRRHIGQLEQEQDAIRACLIKARGSDLESVPVQVQVKAESDWKHWQDHANIRGRICRDLWRKCSEVVPENMTGEELWGNCKFGAKCALAHILPDGRRVNRPNPGMAMGGSHLNLGGRVNPQAYVNQDSALTNSVLSQQRMNGHDPRYASQVPAQDEYVALHAQQQQQQPYDAIPTIDTGLVSDAGSKYGSPVDDLRFPMSPNHRHLTALDAPLPASFDSQGISHAARYGPVAASVPSKFGLELSPPAQRMGAPSDALRNLRDTAYGPDMRKPSSSFIGSSPPGLLEDSIGPRFLHSQRPIKPRVLSASVPRPTALDDWDDSNFPMEEDYLPMNLHDDVLTPQERLRRLSRTDHELSSSHRDLSGLGMSGTSLSKVGSPLASSPSRFGALFAKQRQRKEEDAHGTSLTHIGSPLRESSLNLGTSPSLGPIGSRQISGDVSPFISSPSRQPSMSMISQQLSGISLHPGSARHSSSVGASSRLDRTVSSPVSTSKIDEEQGDLVFSMEEEENNKRNSTSWSPHKTDSNDDEASTPTSNSGFQP
ncbi:spindle poison sensitivity protein Scp3 [Aspergillus sclerotiicarbonarius CBS 121057]|uniref:Spindle poison sensitivity protein Scp3 n=1 Tax=Aspergillus sclerotiicarbonarius (strain CBS 121057 / IBT 28362) TaxID=1448318 RepID=A0A319EJP0_ASPSB|nr:spindle poison sensitivity protein Scp3 [Aspergillus sclerotiicarbonarius CBS 121057]